MVSRDFSYQRNDAEESEFQERVINISRVTKVVKGGRNLSFAADVVIGDGKGLSLIHISEPTRPY